MALSHFFWNCCIPIRSDGYVGFASENPFVFTFVMWVHCCLRGWAASGTALLLLCIKINNVYWALWFEITFLGSLISALVEVGGKLRFWIFRWYLHSCYNETLLNIRCTWIEIRHRIHSKAGQFASYKKGKTKWSTKRSDI